MFDVPHAPFGLATHKESKAEPRKGNLTRTFGALEISRDKVCSLKGRDSNIRVSLNGKACERPCDRSRRLWDGIVARESSVVVWRSRERRCGTLHHGDKERGCLLAYTKRITPADRYWNSPWGNELHTQPRHSTLYIARHATTNSTLYCKTVSHTHTVD